MWESRWLPKQERKLRQSRCRSSHIYRRSGQPPAGPTPSAGQCCAKLVLPVIRGLKSFKLLMTDKSSVKKTRCEPQEQSSFGHGITCQCMKKQLCSGKRACLCRIVFQALASLCTLKTAYELINSQIYRDKTSEVIVILKSNKNF